MFVCSHLVFLQLQKTGGTHIAETLASCVGGRQFQKHRRLDPAYRDRYIVGSVRNPWDWYVSLWAYGSSGKGSVMHAVTKRSLQLSRHLRGIYAGIRNKPEAVQMSIPDGLCDIYRNTLKPVKQWKSSYADPDDPARFRQWLELMLSPERRFDMREGYGFSKLSEVAGFYTYRYLKLYSSDFSELFSGTRRIRNDADLKQFDADNNILDGTIMTERLEDDCIAVLTDAGYTLSTEQKNTILAGRDTKTNTSRHKPTSFYYDSASIELVRAKESLIIDKYSYAPPNLGENT